jgi:thiol:disulfide interchange protein
MSAYIFFETALQILVIAYLISVVLLLAISKFGLAAIETIEEAKKIVNLKQNQKSF